jgi:hypothetical protein
LARWVPAVSRPVLAGAARHAHHGRVSYGRSVVFAAVLATASQARAECPTTPDDPVCRPWSGVLLPTVYGQVYAPNGLPGTYYGGGVEAVLLAWSDNSDAYGPSQGRLRLDVGYLTSSDAAADPVVIYRGGAQVGFERNASRAWGIPYFAADVGGLWSSGTGRRWFVDGGLGLYVVHRRNVIVDVEVTGLLPFSDPSKLGGLSTRLGLSFALW